MHNRFTPEQLKASTLFNKPVSVTASAGSGKTSTLVERYVTLLKSGFHPKEVLTVTFTKEAAQELKDRVEDRALEMGLEPACLEAIRLENRIGTLHSFAFSLLNQYGSEIGLLPIKTLIEDSQFLTTFQKLYRDWLDHISQELLTSLLDHFSHRELEELARAVFKQRHLFKECLRLAQEAQAKDRGASVVSLLAQALEPLLTQASEFFHSQGAYSFDDLETFALQVLRTSPIARNRVRNEIKHILVDEFQDTSAIQWQIINTLLGDQYDKLFIVGDPKQSIYGFRQAEPRLFQEISSLMNFHGGETIELLRNYRTEASLLSHLNEMSEKLFEDQPFGWTPMLLGKTDSNPSPSGFNIVQFGTNEKTSKQALHSLEVQQVVLEVEHLISQSVNPDSIALLFRNSDRIVEFSDALRSHNVSTDCKRTLSLSRQLDALDLISFLQFLSDPLNDSALVFFLRSPYMGFSYEQILSLNLQRQKQDQKPEPLFYALARSPSTKLQWLVDLVRSGETRVGSCLEHLFLNCHFFASRADSLDVLLKILGQDNPDLVEIQNFLEAFSSTDFLFQEESSSATSEGVKLMTVHASKGLEFDHVFLVDCLRQIPQDQPPLLLKAGLPPGIKFWEKDKRVFSGSYENLLEERRQKEAEEARRILYVALTRAKHSLTIFIPKEESTKYPASSWAALVSASVKSERESPPSPEAPIGVGTTY